MNFSFDASQSFSEGNSFADAFAKEGDFITEVQLPQEAFMSVLKMD
ncbi:hypothetical protein KJ870_03010 [bacterium]|jgi:hypothetical protein|nr:hypothetical protein [bacterium]MBU1433892.1 hypothetical protein [bacterium]MBU1503590.1 hypothetical protein [bacterium]MBU3939817.1 hypothetical protein [bacterium]MBU4025695.1 hypothetical protein [bacterium]